MDRRILKTKAAIKFACKNLLLDKKNTRITITELAKTANIDRKTFYLHYDSIDGIIREKLKDNLSELEELLIEHGISKGRFNTNTIISSMNTYIEKDIDFYKALLRKRDSQFFSTELEKILSTIFIQDWTNASNISAKELSIYCNFIVSGITDVYMDWFLDNKAVSLNELGDTLSNIIHSGIQVLSE